MLSRFLDPFLPPCAGCGAASWQWLCELCREDLKLPGDQFGERVWVSYFYSKKFSAWLNEAKSEKPEFFRLITKEDLGALRSQKFEGVVAMASDPRLDARRGFSPSSELARQVSRLLSIRYFSSPFKRVMFLKPQKEMSRVDRLKWLTRTLSLDREAAAKLPSSLLLVDDVWVTGATAAAHLGLLRDERSETALSIFCLAGVPSTE